MYIEKFPQCRHSFAGIVHLTGYVIEAEPDDQEFPYSDEESDEEPLDIERMFELVNNISSVVKI